MNTSIGIVLLLCTLCIAVSGCSGSDAGLCGGIVVTFGVEGEIFNVFITDEDTIEEIYAVQRGESRATIPNGRLVRGSVCYNLPWSWHVDPEDIHMAEATVEFCSGLPSHVEDDLDYFGDIKDSAGVRVQSSKP